MENILSSKMMDNWEEHFYQDGESALFNSVTEMEACSEWIPGICAKDYDVTHIYVDSILKITGETDYERFGQFLDKFNAFLGEKITATIICSRAADVLPESVTKYC